MEEAIQVNKGDGRTRDGHTVYTKGIPRGHMDDVTTSITAYQEQRGHVSQSSTAQIKCTAEECLVTSMHKITYSTFTTHKHINLYLNLYSDMLRMSCVHTLSSCHSSDKVAVIQVQLPLPLGLTEPVTSHL